MHMGLKKQHCDARELDTLPNLAELRAESQEERHDSWCRQEGVG